MGKISRSIMENVSWMQFLEMHFVSLWKWSAVLWIPPWFSREKQKYSAWRETDPDDFFSPGFEVLWYCSFVEHQRAKPGHAWVASDNYGTDHNFISINSGHTFTWSTSSLASKNKISFLKSKWKCNCWQHGPFTLYWPHLNKHPPSSHTTFTARLPHPIQILLGESTMSSLIQ